MDERLTQLEILFTEQKKIIEDMSGEMYQQQKDITSLRLQIKQFEEKLTDLSEAQEIGGQERPPHY